MSRYHTCLMYAVSFAVAGAKRSTGSETTMQIETGPKGTMNYNMQKKYRIIKTTIKRQ